MSAGGADASNVSQTGVPCLDSFGIEGGAYHTIKEYARLSSIPGACQGAGRRCDVL